jgi:cytochrome c-type biogenesis protein CcmE
VKKKNLQLLLGGFLVIIGLLYLIYEATQRSTIYYLTVEEFLDQQERLADEGIRIAGIVAKGSIRSNEASLEVTFVIQGTSGKALLPVRYKGAVPDMLRDGASVVLEGKYNRETNIFQAVTLMTSCPSKYESKLKEKVNGSQR